MTLAVTSFTPTSGNSSGGTTVTITGTGFTADKTTNRVLVGGNEATIVGTPTVTTIVIQTPPGTPASTPKIIVVDTVAGTDAQSTATFSYNSVATEEQLTSTLARKWAVDVDVSVAQDGSDYIAIRAMNSVKPDIADTTQDDTDFESDGWGSDTKTLLKWSLALGLIRKIGQISSNYDPGQEAIRAASDQFGTAGVVRVRWYDRDGGPEAYWGYASVSWSPDGGDATKLDTATVTLNGQGKRNDLSPNPAA